MIQARELRIGNLFYFWPIGCPLVADTVIALRSKSKTHAQLLIKGQKSRWNQETQCHPINLTAKILEKAGFKRENNKDNVYSKRRLRIYLGELNSLTYLMEEDSSYGHYIPQPLYSLHQLQNLYLFLFGEELEITL